MKHKDLTGAEIGILKVLHKTGTTKYKKPSIVYLCECECGVRKEYSAAELSCVKSCGCLRKKNLETFGDRNKGNQPVTTLPPGESTYRTLLARYKQSAKKRRIDFNLDEETFRKTTKMDCYYCGSSPNAVLKDRHRSEGDITYNGIDRVDNEKSYSENNIVPCCSRCNRAKDTMTLTEYKEWLRTSFLRSADWEQSPV
jgi:5-methylcytosine-specific restriction endonuclease McrA